MTRLDKRGGRAFAYVGVFTGLVVSIAANVAESFVDGRPESGAIVGAIFWPVSLLLASEILIRKQWPTGITFLLVRIAGLLPVAAVAAYISYEHLSALLIHYGYSPIAAHIGPLSVDGLMLTASAALLVPDRKPKPAAVKAAEPATAQGLNQHPAVDVDGLMLVGRAVIADLETNGKPVTKTAVIAGVRARGHKMGKDKASALYTALVA